MALRPSYHAFRTGFRQSAIDRIAGSPNGNDKLELIPSDFIRGFSYSEVADRIVESIVSISVDDAKTTFAKPDHAAMAALLAVTPGAKSESAYAEMCALLGGALHQRRGVGRRQRQVASRRHGCPQRRLGRIPDGS